jgi:hypothetical protein
MPFIRYAKIHGTVHRPGSQPCWLTGRPRSRRSRWRTSLPGWPGRSWPRASATRNPPRRPRGARLGGLTVRNAVLVDPAIRTAHNVPSHHRMRAFDRDLIRGGHYGQRSREPRKQAEHIAATDLLHREENPCQKGAVHTWHSSANPASGGKVRCWPRTGHSKTYLRLLCLTQTGLTQLAGRWCRPAG